jgi:actin-related protein 2
MTLVRQKTKTLVCDIGSGSIKVGIAGKLSPDKIIPCLIGCPRYSSRKNSNSACETLVGNDALKKGKYQNIGYRYPMTATGHIQDWESLEIVLERALQDFRITDYSQYKVLITRPNSMTEEDLKMLVDIFLVNLRFCALTMHDQAALVLYTQGVETGVVVDLGESTANIVPVYKGHAISKLDRSLAVGGRSISSYLLKLLRLKGFQLNDEEDLELGRQIKEKVCYVALNPNVDERLATETTVLKESFKLPDGNIISVGRERFGAVEALFQPTLWNSESSGLSDMIFEVINAADIDCRADLYRNVILSGGTSLLPGIQERLERDLNLRYTNDVLDGKQSRSLGWKPQVQAPSSRQHLVFEGAALFADYISDDEKHWISRTEYLRYGVQRVLDKCTIT